MQADAWQSAMARHIWETKYRFGDEDLAGTWRRVAAALARAEASGQAAWEGRFRSALADFRFLPGGRILAGAGTGRRVTLFNCFVMGTLVDSMDGIFDALKEGAVTMQQGGGVGYDFSTLRPMGAPARSVGGIASGPVSFMRIWDSMCATLLSAGARRGAMMATLRCDHPDIERFVDAKRDPAQLRHFNLSVLVSDDFMRAVQADAHWPLLFPERALGPRAPGQVGERVLRRWSGGDQPVPCRVLRVVRARELWQRIMRATYDCAEPGVLFIDTINRANNLAWREQVSATNPCGEIPLPPYGACNLGSINLTRYVRAPFAPDAALDWEGMRATVAVAVRMLDDVIDVSRYPLQAQARQARGARRLGLGFTGLADALIMLGQHYAEGRARDTAARIMQAICHTAYRTSVELAAEKGPFPYFEPQAYLSAPFVAALPQDVREAIARHGIRNSHLTAIAPAGTISLLAGNISGGLEPVFDFKYTRRLLRADGSYAEYPLQDYALGLWRDQHGAPPPPATFVDSSTLEPLAHLRMQAAVAPWVDNAISKTVNVPVTQDFAGFRSLYEQAWEMGLKGCTTFRPNPVTGAVLSAAGAGPQPGPQCCDIEREGD